MDPEVVKWLATAGCRWPCFPGCDASLWASSVYSAMQGLGRNPESRQAIMTNMILVAALTEAVGIYGLVSVIMIVLVA